MLCKLYNLYDNSPVSYGFGIDSKMPSPIKLIYSNQMIPSEYFVFYHEISFLKIDLIVQINLFKSNDSK